MYYKTLAKCGHVGRNRYTLKWFYIKAKNGKDAARIVRQTPRVKHHHKDAIRDVVKIEFEEYINGLKAMNDDIYFKIHNSSYPKLYSYVKEENIYPEEIKKKYRKLRNGQRLKYLAIEKETKKMAQGGWICD